jgi:hypothetical protein
MPNRIITAFPVPKFFFC